MEDNTRTAIGYVCIALVFISWFLMLAWIGSPNEFTIKFEMDNNTKEAVESVEYPIVDIKQDDYFYEDWYEKKFNSTLINQSKVCESIEARK